MLKNLMLKDFVSELSSNAPVPGGGGAAALTASLGCALNSMVFNLTVGKKIYNEYADNKKELINDGLKQSDFNKDEFLRLMDRDAEEFLSLMAVFKFPKNTDEEKKIREGKLQDAYINALKVPLEIAEKAFKIYDYIFTACEYGNVNAISDAGVAALLIQCAIESAVLNVNINLAAIKDENYKSEIKSKCDSLIKQGTEKKNRIMELVNSKIG